MTVEHSGEIPPAVRAKTAVLRRRMEQGSMWLRVDGGSMGRSIPGGSEVLVVPAPRPRTGEVWAFYDGFGSLVVHRCRRTVRGEHVFQGDMRVRIDAVRTEQLIGRVVAVRCSGRTRRLGVFDRIRGWTAQTSRALKARIAS